MPKFRIPITANSEKELERRIAENEKRGFKVIFQRNATYSGMYRDRLYKAIMEKEQ